MVNLILTWLATLAQKKFVGENKKPLDIPMVGATDTGDTQFGSRAV